MSFNPYQPPPSSQGSFPPRDPIVGERDTWAVERLQQLGNAQQGLIGLYVILLLDPTLYLLPQWTLGCVALPFVIFRIIVPIVILYRIAEVLNWPVAALWGLLSIVPVVGFLIAVVAVINAMTVFRKHNIRSTVFGPNKDDLNRAYKIEREKLRGGY